MKKLIWALAVGSFFFGAFLPAGWTAEPVKIGVGLPLTGPLAFLGTEFLKGAQLAAEEINKSGGILGGRKIELVVRDHKGIPAEAVTLAKRLIAEDKVSVIDIDLPSSANIAVHVVSKEMKVVQLTGFGFAPDVTDKGHPYHFRVCTRAESLTRVLGEYLAALPNNKKIAMVAPNDDYGRGDLASMIAVFKKIGNPEVVYEAYYERNQTDFNTILLKMKSLNPDCYYINVRWPASAIVLQQMEDLAMLKGKYLSSSVNFFNKDLAKRVGPLMEGAVMTVSWAPVFKDEESQKLVKAYRAKYGDDPNDSVSLGWSPIMVAAMGINKAGTDKDQEKIRLAIKGLKYNSPQGPINGFDDKGDSGVPAYVLQFKNGEYHLIK
ncbi:MAG TPA: ABC transporter substrate-binding protein [Thermodesulfobacteriota bacterium]|nr:ABC transporter substrate-binding protein [Thermodesulfobacteriota bacterium]